MNNFTANLDMRQCVFELKQRMKRAMAFGIIIAAVMAIRSFQLIGGLRNYEFWLGMAVFVLALRAAAYLKINDKGCIINNTAYKVSLEKEGIAVETYSFELFSWPDKPMKTICFNFNDLYIRKVSYPLNPFIARNSKAFRLSDGGKIEAFINVDSFDQELHDKLDALPNVPLSTNSKLRS